MLKVHLFGSGEASYQDIPVSVFPGQQAGLLLCYLILHRNRNLPRERLAAVFWEDFPTSTARKYLRNALWRLKKSLSSAGVQPGDILAIDEDQIGLRGRSALWIDVEEFELTVSDNQRTPPQALSRQQRQELEHAARLYRGDLLEGIYADWTLHERERLRLLYMMVRQKLMLHYSHTGRYEEGLAHGSGLLAIDPAREKIHRQMMRLYALTGDRNAALAQFKRCKQLLQDELNLPPMRETRRLYRQIKENRFEGSSIESFEENSSDPLVLSRLQRLGRLAGRLKLEVQNLERLLNQRLMDADQ